MSDVLARRHRALTPEETEQLLRDRLDDGVLTTTQEFGVFTVWLSPEAWVPAATLCRDEWRLAYDMFDNLFGVDAREDGFDVVAVLYSTTTGNRIVLRTRCEGGRESPTCPSLTEVYRGADWMERETYDMFGIDFPGHPRLEPRLLTVDNFEGWPLRKDFHLASRVVKPWPGVAEPKELDEDGNVIERETRMGDAPGPYDVDKAIAEQAKIANPRPEDEEADDDGAETSEAQGGADEGSEEPAVELDQEVYDRLIAEGKSDRMARAKAKAAWMKQKKRAQAAEASAEAAPAGDAATDDGGDARQKADQRRREQAEARARKAAERAAAEDADGADDGTEGTDGDDEDGDGQEGA